jgi:hypothetical protein
MSDDKSLKRHDGGLHRGPAHSSPYPVSRLAPAHDLVDVAREIQQADAMVGAVVSNKLDLISEQIRGLQAKAREILDAAARDSELHRVRCNFSKTPGQTYHLYRHPDGSRYFSMLSPDDWRGSPPHPFEGSFRLDVDQSWKQASSVELVGELVEASGARRLALSSHRAWSLPRANARAQRRPAGQVRSPRVARRGGRAAIPCSFVCLPQATARRSGCPRRRQTRPRPRPRRSLRCVAPRGGRGLSLLRPWS